MPASFCHFFELLRLINTVRKIEVQIPTRSKTGRTIFTFAFRILDPSRNFSEIPTRFAAEQSNWGTTFILQKTSLWRIPCPWTQARFSHVHPSLVRRHARDAKTLHFSVWTVDSLQSLYDLNEVYCVYVLNLFVYNLANPYLFFQVHFETPIPRTHNIQTSKSSRVADPNRPSRRAPWRPQRAPTKARRRWISFSTAAFIPISSYRNRMQWR